MPKNNINILTPKQSKVVNGILANMSKEGKTKTLKQIVRDAGYSEGMTKTPSVITNSPAVKNKLEEVVEMMEEKRKMALQAITSEKVRKASALSNAYTIDILTKNTQLLTGKRTGLEPININIVRYSEDVEPIKPVEPSNPIPLEDKSEELPF